VWDPDRTSATDWRGVRGGSIGSSCGGCQYCRLEEERCPFTTRSAFRNAVAPHVAVNHLGFRVVRDVLQDEVEPLEEPVSGKDQ
jgi:formylglycine-generating enzyme required for sulfatase activity